MSIVIAWFMTLCRHVDVCQQFGGKCHHVSLHGGDTFSETLVTTYRTTWRQYHITTVDKINEDLLLTLYHTTCYIQLNDREYRGILCELTIKPCVIQ